jgi:hypothetical protein
VAHALPQPAIFFNTLFAGLLAMSAALFSSLVKKMWFRISIKAKLKSNGLTRILNLYAYTKDMRSSDITQLNR